MGTNYKISIAGKEKVVSGEELDILLARDTAGMIEILGPGTADSVYQNREGWMVNEKLDATQLRARKALGEQNILFGADDPKRQALRRSDQQRFEERAAQDYGGYAALRNFIPGIQAIENQIVGEDEATHLRQNLLSQNRWWHMGGQLGAFFAAGGALKRLFPGTFISRAIGAKRNTLLGKTGQLIAEDVLLETHLYTQHILNNNQDFIIEDWAEQVSEGLIFTSPFYGSFAARAGAAKGINALRGRYGGQTIEGVRAVASGLDLAAMGMVTRGLTQTGQAAGKTMRWASGTRLGERILRRFGGRGTRKVIDTADQARKVKTGLEKELKEINTFTPEKFASWRKTAGRTEGLQRLRELSGHALEGADDINFDHMVGNVRDAHKAARGFKDRVRKLNVQAKYPANITDPIPPQQPELPNRVVGRPFKSEIDDAMYDLRWAETFDELEKAGYPDVAAYLENTAYLPNPKEGYGKWVQSRFQAKMNSKGTPFETTAGATKADEAIRKFLEDPEVWGENLAGRSVQINEAIDIIADSWDELYQIGDALPKHMGDVGTEHFQNFARLDQVIDRVKGAFDELHRQGIYTEKDFRLLDDALLDTRRTMMEGRQSMLDMKKINDAVADARDINKAKKEAAEAAVPKTKEELAALQAEAAADAGSSMVVLRELVGKALDYTEKTGGVPGTRNLSFGVIALRHGAEQGEKEALFEQISETVRALAGNPAALSQRMADLTRSLGEADAVYAHRVQQTAATQIYYLLSQLPKRDASFNGGNVPVHPSTVNAFLDKAIATYQPISVGVLAALGGVTPDMVQAVKATNPAIYQEMYTVFASELAKLTPEERSAVPRTRMFSIETFLGGLSPAYNGYNLMQLQSTYTQTQAQEQVMRGTAHTGNTMKNAGPQQPGSDYTFSQRIMGY